MSKYIKYTLIISVFIFVSCEKVIKFDAEVKEPKLVLNALMQADSSLTVHISHSLSVIDIGEIQNVQNASVILYDNNENAIETLNYISDGYYKGNYIIQPNTEYIIKASAPIIKISILVILFLIILS